MQETSGNQYRIRKGNQFQNQKGYNPFVFYENVVGNPNIGNSNLGDPFIPQARQRNMIERNRSNAL